uniref:OTU domain-containing protein n=1 Tax=Magallana gigas TaxID=29159 RepID=A0A8W8M7M7_MAGGI
MLEKIKSTPGISTGKEIVGDGNCFYRAISLYYIETKKIIVVRREIIQYMSEREHEYSRLMFDRNQNYEGYLDHHRNDGVWAEHPRFMQQLTCMA